MSQQKISFREKSNNCYKDENGSFLIFSSRQERTVISNTHWICITLKRPQPGPPQDFQPIRNRSLNKEMNVRTSRELSYFFDWLVSILNFWPCSKALGVFTAEMQTLLILLPQREIILDLDL